MPEHVLERHLAPDPNTPTGEADGGEGARVLLPRRVPLQVGFCETLLLFRADGGEGARVLLPRRVPLQVGFCETLLLSLDMYTLGTVNQYWFVCDLQLVKGKAVWSSLQLVKEKAFDLMPATCNELGAVLLRNRQTMGHTSGGTVNLTFLLLTRPGTYICHTLADI